MKRMTFQIEIKGLELTASVEAVNDEKALDALWDEIRNSISISKLTEEEIPQTTVQKIWNKILCL